MSGATFYVSPKFTAEDWHSGRCDDVDVVVDQLQGWILDQASALDRNQHAGPAILLLTAPYYEAIGCYSHGREPKLDESGLFLETGLSEVFPAATEPAKKAYRTQVRNGLAHEAVFRRVLIHRAAAEPKFDIRPDGILAVDPWWMLGMTRSHLVEFARRLRDPSCVTLRASFDAFLRIRKSR
jgi:hypothetical protein